VTSSNSDPGEAPFDDPSRVAQEIADLATPTLLVLDCDGVLAPLVDHADDSRLLDGVDELLRDLAETGVEGGRRLTVAVLSGRSLDGLAQFEFAPGVVVVGSYGGERRHREPAPLDTAEADRLAALVEAVERARDLAGEGAWIEHKPTSVVLHVRTADPEAGTRALGALEDAHRGIPGSTAHHGSNVLELMARPTDKGIALQGLRQEESANAVVYLGDDVPDEDAFAVLGPGDLSVKIGPGPTRADRRLEDPAAVRRLLADLLARLGTVGD
jgi:trehalose-phosphatase